MANTIKNGEFSAPGRDIAPKPANTESRFDFHINRKSIEKFIKNTAVCAFIAIGILTLKGISETSKSELIQDKDLGRLQFVSSVSDIAIPIDGEIVETFSSNGEYCVIEGTRMDPVFSLFDGTVVKTGTDFMVIQNANGTNTTYTGVIPGLKAGTDVMGNEAIGQLSGEKLTLTTVGGIGYVDSLALPEELG